MANAESSEKMTGPRSVRTDYRGDPLSESVPALAPEVEGRCANHFERAAVYICSECSAPYCRECAKPAGHFNVRACKICGGLCLPYADHQRRQRLLADRCKPFGVSDLGLAVVYPFRQILSTLILGLIFGASLFSLPFFNISKAGLLLGGIGLLPALTGVSLMLGCVIQFIGRAEAGAHDGPDAQDVVPLLSDLMDTMVMGAAVVLASGGPYFIALVTGLAHHVSPWLFLCWSVFYYPSALIVAYRTGRFWPTVNPLSGFVAVWELRSLYAKLLIFYFVGVALVGLCLRFIVLSVLDADFSPLAYLLLGLVIGPPIWYANTALGCLIGRMLFKAEAVS